MSRNYKKEYDNYHSRPEQKIRRAARNAARAQFKDADPNKDVHHKDNNPLNNDKNNLSLVTQHYNRREPRLREEDVKEMSAIDDKQFRNKVAQLIQISGRNDTAGLETRVMYQSSDALRKSTRAFQLHFQKQRSSNVRELIAKAVNKAMDKKDIFQVWDAPFAKMITAFGENIDEGLTDPQELAKEIEWGVSPKNVDSRVLSTKQKKQMKDIVKLMKRSKAPNWVSKFTQVYFTSDKLVQQRLKSAAKRGGMSPELMKKLFKEGLAVLPKGGFRNQFEPEITAWEKKLGKKIKKKLSPQMKKDLMKFLKQKYGSAARHFKIPDVIEGVDGDAMIDLMQKYLLSKNPKEKKTLLKQINRYQKKLGLKVTEDMGSVTGAHIAGTGDDNTVHTKPKKRRLAKRLRKYGLK